MRIDASVSDKVLLVASPGVLVVLAVVGLVNRGEVGGVPLVLLVVGLATFVVAGLGLVLHTEIDADGIHRRTLLRGRTIAWEELVAIERHRGRPGGPFVARSTDRRRVALASRVERPDEWDRLCEIVERHAPGVAMPGPPPHHPFSQRDTG